MRFKISIKEFCELQNTAKVNISILYQISLTPLSEKRFILFSQIMTRID